jgi:predicted transcriptional regulator
MSSNQLDCTIQGNDNSGADLDFAPDGGGMSKEERKAQSLKLLDESDMAVTPYVLFRNLKFRGATFERRTLATYLSEFVEDGLVEKIEVDGDPLYRITDEGREFVRNYNFH